MNEVRLAIIGYGNVAEGLTQILDQCGEEYAQLHGLKFLITSITDPSRGTALDPEGIAPGALLQAVRQPEALESLPVDHPGWDAMEMIQNSPADVVLELSYTNLQTGEPAATYIREALRRRKHVVTTNKGPIALHYDELYALAHVHGVQIGIEGTVMSGTPALRVGSDVLNGARIRKIEGILNGTTNYILSSMENGLSYQEALSEAQNLGYAEADPTGDVEGFDAAAKVSILSRLVMGAPVAYADINRTGISGIAVEDITRARAEGNTWKLIGKVERNGNGVKASVGPACLPSDHPLAQVKGATNAILYTTDFLGDVTIVGPGAGRVQTGYAIIQDLFAIYGIKSQ